MGFKVNIEFIYGHPGETLQNWIDVIEEACTLGVDEIQLYRLKIEPYGDQEGTIKKFSAYHNDELISVEDTIRMKEISNLILADHGYTENLRRVFTKSKKNISIYAYNQCCRLRDEVGFGISAFSSLNDRFLINTPDFEDYYIDKALFKKINHVDIESVFQGKFNLLKKYGLITETDKKIELTTKGAFYSDEIVHVFYENQHQSFPPEDFKIGCLNPYNK